MIVIPGNTIVYFDVDDTLVMWDPPKDKLEAEGIDVICPAGLICVDGNLEQAPGFKAKLLPHKKHIEKLKKHKMRGHTVVVWSAGGYDWAEAAIKVLQLEKYVDVVISKPKWAYDDMPPERILPTIQWDKDE